MPSLDEDDVLSIDALPGDEASQEAAVTVDDVLDAIALERLEPLEQAGANDLSKTLEQIEAEEYPLVSKTGKRYRYKEPGLREYVNGTLYREGKGIARSPKHTQITPEKAIAMQAHSVDARLENKVKRAIDGFEMGIKEVAGDNPNVPQTALEAWGYYAGKASATEGRNQVAALRLAAEGPLELIGKRNEAASTTNGQVSLTLTGNVSDLRQVMGNRYAQQGGDNNNYRKHDDVIDVQVTTPHEDTDTEQNK